MPLSQHSLKTKGSATLLRLLHLSMMRFVCQHWFVLLSTGKSSNVVAGSSSLLSRPSRIAFGSCNKQDMQNDLWPIIDIRKPIAFIWGGDAIYADTQGAIDWTTFPPRSTHQCATPRRLRALYQQQLRDPGYRALIEQNVTIFGTFDDHDFGCDNSDGTFEHKYISGLEYINFIGLSQHSAMRERAVAGHGVYGVKLFDFARPPGNQEVPEWEAGIDSDIDVVHQPGTFSSQTVAVFVLDVRTSKTPWKKGPERFHPNYDGDFLGERQWQWFESSIRRSRASVNVVLNGLQVHASRYPDGNVAESWERYPRAQHRLFDALLQDGVESPILVSGDVHKTEFMRKDCVRTGKIHSKRRRPLVELTTSGMTHSWGTSSKPLLDPNTRSTLLQQYQLFASNVLLHSMHNLVPWNDIMKASPDDVPDTAGLHENGGGEGARSGLQYSLEQNFGELEFDWEQRTIALRSMGKNVESPPLLMAKLSMDQLSGRASIRSPHLSADDFRLATPHQPHVSDWICINHRGRETQLGQFFGYISTLFVLTTVVSLPMLVPLFLLLWISRTIVNKPRGTKRVIGERMFKSKTLIGRQSPLRYNPNELS